MVSRSLGDGQGNPRTPYFQYRKAAKSEKR
jgi:hypothetical protein